MMKPRTEDEVDGAFHEVKGKVREEIGNLTNSPDLEADGKAEKNAREAQKAVSSVEKAFENDNVGW